MPTKLFTTPSGKERLKHTRTALHKQIATATAVLRAAYVSGDEDSAAMALSRLQQLEAKQLRVEAALHQARQPGTPSAQTVQLGSTVQLEAEGLRRRFTLAGTPKAGPCDNCISPDSPLGHSLLHRHTGDDVTIQTLGKALTFHILQVD